MSVFSKIIKRAALPIEINGGLIHVAEPTYGEIDRVEKLQGPLRTGLSLAFCVVNENGEKAVPQNEGETDSELAARMVREIDDITPSALDAIIDAVKRLAKPQPMEKLQKN